MWDWFVKTFGACNNRFFHLWVYFRDSRSCAICNKTQRKAGTYQPDTDLAPMTVWEDVT